MVFHRSRAWTDAGSRGYQLLIEDGKLSWSLVHFWPGNAISIQTTSEVTPGEWTHVAVTYDGSSRADGLSIYVNGQLADTEITKDNLYKNITGGGGDNIAIGERFRDRGFKGGAVDGFRVVGRELTPVEVAEISGGNSLASLLSTAVEKLNEAQRADLFAYYLSNFDAEYQKALGELQSARQERGKAVDGVREMMVMSAWPGNFNRHLTTGHRPIPRSGNRGCRDAAPGPASISDSGFSPGEPPRLICRRRSQRLPFTVGWA